MAESRQCMHACMRCQRGSQRESMDTHRGPEVKRVASQLAGTFFRDGQDDTIKREGIDESRQQRKQTVEAVQKSVESVVGRERDALGPVGRRTSPRLDNHRYHGL